jgi:hypothetical protein
MNAYLDMACIGFEIKLNLALKVLPNPTKQVKRLGSVMVCNPDNMGWLCLKYDHLIVLGQVRCKWMDNNTMTKLHGNPENLGAGIWFPDNAHIDLLVYARMLLDTAARMGTTTGGRWDREEAGDNNADGHGCGGLLTNEEHQDDRCIVVVVVIIVSSNGDGGG